MSDGITDMWREVESLIAQYGREFACNDQVSARLKVINHIESGKLYDGEMRSIKLIRRGESDDEVVEVWEKLTGKSIVDFTKMLRKEINLADSVSMNIDSLVVKTAGVKQAIQSMLRKFPSVDIIDITWAELKLLNEEMWQEFVLREKQRQKQYRNVIIYDNPYHGESFIPPRSGDHLFGVTLRVSDADGG